MGHEHVAPECPVWKLRRNCHYIPIQYPVYNYAALTVTNAAALRPDCCDVIHCYGTSR